jgi:hypothetical protein
MKKILTLVIGVAMISSFYSCEKKIVEPYNEFFKKISEKWWGKRGASYSAPGTEWGFVIRQDSTMVVNTGTQSSPTEWGKGTWTIANDSLKASINSLGEIYTFKAGISSDSKQLSGYYFGSGNIAGYFVMDKK